MKEPSLVTHRGGLRAWSILALAAILALSMAYQSVAAPEFLPGDALPDAPALAARGTYEVGVRTILLVHTGQVDVVHATAQNPSPLYDRPVTIEVWYPAQISRGRAERTTYTDCLAPETNGSPLRYYTFAGRALRDADPDAAHGPYPLIVVSHGYTGSRLNMTNLTENLASKGYVVAAIDHADSTTADVQPIASTLVNRWADITYVMDQFEAAGQPGAKGSLLAFTAGLVDVHQTALIGYSMGGYGVLNVAGAGYAATIQQAAGGRLTGRLAGSPGFAPDPRVRAVVAIAPYGMEEGLWDASGLAGLHAPTLFIDGDHDDVAGYTNGVRTIFEHALNANRYLLVYENARHAVAGNPPPNIDGISADDYLQEGESAWDTARINNVNQHFITAFLDTFVKGLDDSAYLSVPQNPGLNDWKGFPARSAVGLEFWHLPAADSSPH